MIPVNFSALTPAGTDAFFALIQSDENVIGTTSPAEVISFVVAVIFAYIIGVAAAFYLKRRFSHKMKKDQLDFWIKAVRVLLVIAAISVTIPAFFDASLTIIAGIVIGLVAVFALAGQKIITNFLCGIAIRYEHPFTSGDYITAGETSGTVVSITPFATIVRTTNGVSVHIPNEKVYAGDVSNFYLNVARRYDYELGIRYRDDIGQAIRIITGMLDSYQFVLKYPAPEAFVSDLADSSVKIKVRVWFPSAWAHTQDDVSLRTHILPEIKRALEAAGIAIPFPQRVVWFGNETQKNRPDDR
jgi:small-conductance mechanosensitive channel